MYSGFNFFKLDETAQPRKTSNISSSSPAASTESEFAGSASNSFTTIASTEPLVSFRYEHAQDENGNHVVIGREGKLQHCEDEVGGPLFYSMKPAQEK